MRATQTAQPPLIRIVDDDASVRRALTRLVESMGMRAQAYGAPSEILESELVADAACLLLDVQLPGMSGFELYRRLCSDGRPRPVIFITAHRDGDARSRAAQAGAVAFLEKPFDDELLLASIRDAIERCE